MSAFDRMSSMIENGGSSWVSLLRGGMERAAYFSVPDYVTPDMLDDAGVEADGEVRLPFPLVAVENSWGCCLLQTQPDNLPDIRERYEREHPDYSMIECKPGDIAFCMFIPSDEAGRAGWARGVFRPKPGCQIAVNIAGLGEYRSDGARIIDRTDQLAVNKAVPKQSIAGIVSNFANSIRLINSPSRFVFESRPLKQRANPKKILRSHERPKYVMLTPAEIKRHYLPDPDRTPEDGVKNHRTPHAKRGHYRTLHAERFVNKRGQRIWVEACWVGPQERIANGRLYKVRLDL